MFTMERTTIYDSDDPNLSDKRKKCCLSLSLVVFISNSLSFPFSFLITLYFSLSLFVFLSNFFSLCVSAFSLFPVFLSFSLFFTLSLPPSQSLSLCRTFSFSPCLSFSTSLSFAQPFSIYLVHLGAHKT